MDLMSSVPAGGHRRLLPHGLRSRLPGRGRRLARARARPAPRTDTFAALDDTGSKTTSGPLRWGAGRGLRSLVEDLAAGLAIEPGRTVECVRLGDGLSVDDQPAAAVVLAMPVPQAVRLLDDSLADVRATLDHQFEPVLALTATFEERPLGPRRRVRQRRPGAGLLDHLS